MAIATIHHCHAFTGDNPTTGGVAMRRILATLVVLTAATGLPVSAGASVPQYIYRSCNEYGIANVCLKANVVQQSDGLGWNVIDVRIMGYTDGESICDNIFDGGHAGDPNIYNYAVDVWKTHADGSHYGNPMHRESPDLADYVNGCFFKYEPGISPDSVNLDVSWNYKARLNGNPDPTDTLWIRIDNDGSFTCGDADVCSRA